MRIWILIILGALTTAIGIGKMNLTIFNTGLLFAILAKLLELEEKIKKIG